MATSRSLARQVRRLQQSRLRWKQRVADKQCLIRQLRVTVRDLSASRTRWKQRCRAVPHPPAAAADPAPRLLPVPACEATAAADPAPRPLPTPAAPQESPLGGP